MYLRQLLFYKKKLEKKTSPDRERDEKKKWENKKEDKERRKGLTWNQQSVHHILTWKGRNEACQSKAFRNIVSEIIGGSLRALRYIAGFFCVLNEPIVKVGSVEVRYQRSRPRRWGGVQMRVDLFLLPRGRGPSPFIPSLDFFPRYTCMVTTWRHSTTIVIKTFFRRNLVEINQLWTVNTGREYCWIPRKQMEVTCTERTHLNGHSIKR